MNKSPTKDSQRIPYQRLHGIRHPSLYGLEKEIRKMAFKGGKMRDLMRLLGIGYSATRSFLDDETTDKGVRYYDIWKAHKKSPKEEKKRKRNYHCLKGKEYLILGLAEKRLCGTEIAEEIGNVCSGTINSFLKSCDKYFDGRKRRRRGPVTHEVINESVRKEEGATLNKLSDLSGLTKEGVRQYLITHDIYNLWKEGREKVKLRRKALYDNLGGEPEDGDDYLP